MSKERKMKERPDFTEEYHLEYLDDLRESGITNMWGAAPYLESEYPELEKQQAREILFYWMDSFSKRHGLE